jgi:hypothetical protein
VYVGERFVHGLVVSIAGVLGVAHEKCEDNQGDQQRQTQCDVDVEKIDHRQKQLQGYRYEKPEQPSEPVAKNLLRFLYLRHTLRHFWFHPLPLVIFEDLLHEHQFAKLLKCDSLVGAHVVRQRESDLQQGHRDDYGIKAFHRELLLLDGFEQTPVQSRKVNLVDGHQGHENEIDPYVPRVLSQKLVENVFQHGRFILIVQNNQTV